MTDECGNSRIPWQYSCNGMCQAFVSNFIVMIWSYENAMSNRRPAILPVFSFNVKWQKMISMSTGWALRLLLHVLSPEVVTKNRDLCANVWGSSHWIWIASLICMPRFARCLKTIMSLVDQNEWNAWLELWLCVIKFRLKSSSQYACWYWCMLPAFIVLYWFMLLHSSYTREVISTST